MRLALLQTDSREHDHEYARCEPAFGTAPEALLQGLAVLPELEVHVVSCARQPMRSPEKLAENIFFHSLHVPELGWLRTLYQGCVRAARRKMQEIRPDIVHGQGTERDCALSAVLSGYPNVVTVHGNMAELARLFRARFGRYLWLVARLENFTLPRTAGVLCNSAYTENLVRPRAKKVWRVPNALRREFFDLSRGGPPEARCRLFNVGAITPRKRQLELLDWAGKLWSKKLQFELHFVGPLNPAEPYGAAFRERLKPLAAAGYARYWGICSTRELTQHLDSASGLIHFPSEEAFGLVVAEALARNLKFFGARLGGIVEIASGVPGADLFEPDDWTGLMEAIEQWIKAGSPRMDSAAALMCQRYHPQVIARRHLEIYQEVLGRQPA